MSRRHWYLCAFSGLLLASSLLAADAPQIPDVLTDEIARIRSRMSSPVADYRIEGAQGAFYLKLQSFEPELIGLLRDPDPLVRQEAVRALARCGTWRSVIHLIALLGDPEWPVRDHAHLALRRLTGQSLEPTREAWTKWWSAGPIGPKQMELLARITTGPPEGRGPAAEALRAMATPEMEDQILKFLDEGGVEADAQASLIEALDRIGTAKSLPCLIKRAGEGNAAAAWAVGSRGSPEAEEALLAGFRRNRSLDFLLNLDRVKSTKCGPFLAALCRSFTSLISPGSRSEDVRFPPTPYQRAAANLIRRSGKGPILVNLVLAEMEGKPKEDAIPDDLKPIFEDLRKVLVPGFVREGFGQCGSLLSAFYHVADDKALVPRLIPLMKSDCYIVRVYAALTLGSLRDPAAVEPILAIIKTGYPFSDSTSATSGKHTSEFRVVDGKKQRQSQTVRLLGYFCIALGRLGNDEARCALEALATDPNSPNDVRYGSVIGLGFIASPKSLPALKKVAQDDLIWMTRDTAKRTARDIEIAGQATTATTGGSQAY